MTSDIENPRSAPLIRRARNAFLWVGVILPMTMLALAAVVILVWLPELPDPVATHWGAAGVDGFGPRWTVLIQPLIGAGIVALFAGITLGSSRMSENRGQAPWSQTARLMGAASLAAGGLISTLAVGSTALQRGLADAADTPDITGWLLVGFVLAVALGVVGWFLQPSVRAEPARSASPAALPLARTERAAWLGAVAIARSGQAVLGVAMLVLLITTAVVVARAPIDDGWGPAWLLVGLCVLVLLMICCGLAFRVRVSEKGLQVRSLLGWPNTRIPLDDITGVEVAQIDPFAEFGGWGWRIAMDGRRGVVLRNGPALQVTRRDGKVFVVTVDGADEAAAVLDALRIRAANGKRH